MKAKSESAMMRLAKELKDRADLACQEWKAACRAVAEAKTVEEARALLKVAEGLGQLKEIALKANEEASVVFYIATKR